VQRGAQAERAGPDDHDIRIHLASVQQQATQPEDRQPPLVILRSGAGRLEEEPK
jgi:thioredoxin-like negative regulator of GroEL